MRVCSSVSAVLAHGCSRHPASRGIKVSRSADETPSCERLLARDSELKSGAVVRSVSPDSIYVKTNHASYFTSRARNRKQGVSRSGYALFSASQQKLPSPGIDQEYTNFAGIKVTLPMGASTNPLVNAFSHT